MQITTMGNTAVCPHCHKTVRLVQDMTRISNHNAAPGRRCPMSGRTVSS